MTCQHCTAETTNGLALCELCQRLASEIFAVLPVYFRNLSRWRPGRAGSRPVPGSRVLYVGEVTHPERTGDRISDSLDEAANMLTTWARVLVDARPYLTKLLDRLSAARQAETIDEAQAVAWLCLGLERFLTSVATVDWCGEFVRDLSHHEARLRGLTEQAAPGWYAGECRRCSTPTHVVPGLTWVTCAGCGATTYARDHLDVVKAEARGWVARPMRLAEAVVALVDTELSVPRLHKRISKWGEREQIPTVRDHDYAPKRFRFGDVLDRLAVEGATRLDDVAARQAS